MKKVFRSEAGAEDRNQRGAESREIPLNEGQDDFDGSEPEGSARTSRVEVRP